MTKTKLLVDKAKDLIILANEQLSAGHYEAGAMVIKSAIDKAFIDVEASVGELENELALTKKELEEAHVKLKEFMAAVTGQPQQAFDKPQEPQAPAAPEKKA